jgi:zinc D-Ala-D-Ala carboxypeptidase
MTYSEPARTTTPRIRIRRTRVASLLVVVAAIAAALRDQLLASSSSTASSANTGASPTVALRSEHSGALGEADGAIPNGTTVFDDGVPGVAKLDRALLRALRQAATDAAAVATPNTSAHVSGDAVVIGPVAATAWLSAHGATYGLCQIYSNEPWHYELPPEGIDHGCPPIYADPAHDPRTRQ